MEFFDAELLLSEKFSSGREFVLMPLWEKLKLLGVEFGRSCVGAMKTEFGLGCAV